MNSALLRKTGSVFKCMTGYGYYFKFSKVSSCGQIAERHLDTVAGHFLYFSPSGCFRVEFTETPTNV